MNSMNHPRLHLVAIVSSLLSFAQQSPRSTMMPSTFIQFSLMLPSNLLSYTMQDSSLQTPYNNIITYPTHPIIHFVQIYLSCILFHIHKQRIFSFQTWKRGSVMYFTHILNHSIFLLYILPLFTGHISSYIHLSIHSIPNPEEG